MVPQTDDEKRNRLAYLALYYAIHGDENRSEQIRQIIRNLNPRDSAEEIQVPAGVHV